MYSSPRPVINPTDIQQIIAMREAREALRKRSELIDEALGGLEAKIVALVDSGADTANLGAVVSVHETSRRYPAWKEHFISRLGKFEADAVLESTIPSVSRKLVLK